MAGSRRKGSIPEFIHDAGWIIIGLLIIAVAIWLVWKVPKAGAPILDKISGIVACKQSVFSIDCLKAVWNP